MSRLLLSFCFVLVFACDKDNNGRTLVGKWISVEMYADAAQGGCGCWTIVLPHVEHTIEFKFDGTFTFMPPLISAMAVWSGDYHKSSDSSLSWTWINQQRTDRFYFENTFLIIERGLTDGVTKTRYRRIPF